MSVLILTELDELRHRFAKGQEPDWDKPAANITSQRVEDALIAGGFDPTDFVLATNTTNARSQTVADGLAGGLVPAWEIPIVEDYLVVNPPSVTSKAVDETKVVDWLAANRGVINGATRDMPPAQRSRVAQIIAEWRVEGEIRA